MQTEAVWNKFRDELYGFILSRVHDSDAAGDILQDTFVKIHLHLNNLRSQDKLTSWVYQITRNAITDYFRKSTRKLDVKELDSMDDDPQTYLQFEKCIFGFIKELPEKYQDALVKTELGNLSQKEYASQLGISYSGAKSRVQRAKEELRSRFVNCCGKKIDEKGEKIEFKDPEDCKC